MEVISNLHQCVASIKLVSNATSNLHYSRDNSTLCLLRNAKDGIVESLISLNQFLPISSPSSSSTSTSTSTSISTSTLASVSPSSSCVEDTSFCGSLVLAPRVVKNCHFQDFAIVTSDTSVEKEEEEDKEKDGEGEEDRCESVQVVWLRSLCLAETVSCGCVFFSSSDLTRHNNKNSPHGSCLTSQLFLSPHLCLYLCVFLFHFL